MSLESNNMNNQVLYPSEILDAVNHAKSDKDKNGYSAFRIGVDRFKKADLVTYYPFEVKVRGSDGHYNWTPVSLKFVNLTHVGRILPLAGGDLNRATKKIYSVTLLFKGNYEYTRAGPNNTRVTEQYGLAKQIISKAFEAHANFARRNGHITKNTKIIGNVKFTQEVKEGNKNVTKTLDTPNINIGLRFAGKITDEQGVKNETKAETLFQCKILDANRPKDKYGREEFSFHDAMLQDDSGEYTVPICNGNIHRFIRGGSIITGVENMRSCSLSNMGFSLPATCEVIFVKQAMATRIAPSIFANDFADIMGAETPILIEEPVAKDAEIPTEFDSVNDDEEELDGDLGFD